MKKIVLISVGQPSTNPRLVKEADTLALQGFDVYVIYSYRMQWAWEADKVIFEKARWKPILAGGSPYQNKLTYFISRLRVKLAGFMARNITFKYGIAEIAKGRTYPDLLKKARSIKADLYIGHILAALPVAVNAAKKNNVKCGFDIEDFHRQEVSDDVTSSDYRISKYLEDKYLPCVDYITASSPLIAEKYSELYNRNVPVLLNVFPQMAYDLVMVDKHSRLKLFWFSQTIGVGRGLEEVLAALDIIEDCKPELHLLGQLPDNADGIFDKSKASIVFHEPLTPDDIPGFAAQFDVGLAVETQTPYNRDICLTNKIFTYVQAGLAIIARNTASQQALLNQYPHIGKTYSGGNPEELANVLRYYHHNREALQRTRQAALQVGMQELNWEIESQKFLAVVDRTLNES